MSARQLTFDDHRRRTGRGGPRAGAGRPRGLRPLVYHVRREELRRDHPAHVTLRVRRDIGSLRTRGFVVAFRRSLRSACERSDFRITQFSIQRDHVHLIAEASHKHALARGMQSIAARLARLANRSRRRNGPVLLGRYHVRATPVKLDEASSGAWFDGWSRSLQPVPSAEPPPVALPHTWLLRVGWRRHGLIDAAEVPGTR